MQKDRGGKDFRDPFSMFGGFGSFEGFGGSIFRRSPFDDPFFTHSFSSMSDRRTPIRDFLPVNPPNEPIIRELNFDDDDGGEEMEDEGMKSQEGQIPNNDPFVDHPDDEDDDDVDNGIDANGEHANYRTDLNRTEGTQAQTFKVHSCKVTYGGIDGAYYTSSSTRRMGSDGVIMEECKEADKTKGEATHRISRGLNDKGHSLTRKLNSDGNVETLQRLHNLNEDELGSFDEAWKGKGMHLPAWRGSSSGRADRISDLGGLLLPSTRPTGETWGGAANDKSRADRPSGRTGKVVRIPIE